MTEYATDIIFCLWTLITKLLNVKLLARSKAKTKRTCAPKLKLLHVTKLGQLTLKMETFPTFYQINQVINCV